MSDTVPKATVNTHQHWLGKGAGPNEPDHPLAREIYNRPEVRDVERICLPAGRERFIVTFKGWSMPADFDEDYGFDIDDFYVRDARPTWQIALSIGVGPQLEVSFSRDLPALQKESDSA